jgi:hypothetical protein
VRRLAAFLTPPPSVQYSKLFEAEYQGRTSEAAWVLTLGATTLTFANWAFNIRHPILCTPPLHAPPCHRPNAAADSLIFFTIYIWARRHPTASMSVFGLFNIAAPYFPWFLAFIQTLSGGSLLMPVLGMVVGHGYHFFNDLYQPTARLNLFKPPLWLCLTPPQFSNSLAAASFATLQPIPAPQREGSSARVANRPPLSRGGIAGAQAFGLGTSSCKFLG